MSGYNRPLGVLRHDELLNILRALAQSRPDYTEALTAVALATGLEDRFQPELQQPHIVDHRLSLSGGQQ